MPGAALTTKCSLGDGGPAAALLAGASIIGLSLEAVIPLCMTVWMGVSAMRGSTGRLPVLGRWAAQAAGVSLTRTAERALHHP
jgi:hypothetical protein